MGLIDMINTIDTELVILAGIIYLVYSVHKMKKSVK